MDTINGGGGIDIIDGGNGNDYLSGDADGDIISGGQDDDELFGDGGGDILYGQLGDDTLHGGVGNDTLIGGNGTNPLYGDAGDDVLKVSFPSPTNTFPTLDGGDDHDLLIVDAVDPVDLRFGVGAIEALQFNGALGRHGRRGLLGNGFWNRRYHTSLWRPGNRCNARLS